MPLVPEKTYSKWFEKDHWMYRQFAYFFCNPIWKKTVPKAFSLCPYFWMSIASFLFIRCLLVPLYMVTAYPLIVLPLKLLAKAFPVAYDGLAAWTWNLYGKADQKNKVLNFIMPPYEYYGDDNRYDENPEKSRNSRALVYVATFILIILLVGLVEGSAGLIAPNMLSQIPILFIVDQTRYLAIHFDKIAMLLAPVQIVALVTAMYMENDTYVSYRRTLTWIAMLIPKIAFLVLFLAGIVVGGIGITVWIICDWLWNTGLPNFVYYIMSMAYGAYEIVRSIWLSSGDGQSAITPFLYGMLTTVFLICAYRACCAVYNFICAVRTPYSITYNTTVEDIISLLADTYVNNEFYSTPLLDHLLCNHPKLTDSVRLSVVKTLVTDAIREEMKLNEKFQDLVFYGRVHCGTTFRIISERIRTWDLPFAACLASANTPMPNNDIFKLLETRIKRMAKKYGMRKMVNRIVADLPEARACVAAAKEEEKKERGIFGRIKFALVMAVMVFLRLFYRDVLAHVINAICWMITMLFRFIVSCVRFIFQTAHYTIDVCVAMKKKACPVVWFRDPETKPEKEVPS